MTFAGLIAEAVAGLWGVLVPPYIAAVTPFCKVACFPSKIGLFVGTYPIVAIAAFLIQTGIQF
jgi:hypothetical protein